jgi:inorganic pyrophosphatase
MEETFMPLNDMRKLKRSTSHGSNAELDLDSKGDQDTLDYRIQAVDASGKKSISLWHDISLTHLDEKTDADTGYLNFVCEIPKFTR